MPIRIHALTSLFCALALLTFVSCKHPMAEASCTGTTVQLRHPKILDAGVDLTFAPFAFDDPKTHSPTGFEVQLIKGLAKRLGLKFLLENRTSAALIPGVLAQRHDVAASGLRDTPALQDEACLSNPYLDADLGLAIMGGSEKEIGGRGDLGGRKVGVLRGSRSETWARAHLPKDAVITPLSAPEDTLNLLMQGRVDAVVDEIPSLWFAETKTDVRVIEDIPTGQHYVLVVGPDNAGLRDAVNSALLKMTTDGSLGNLKRRWFGI